MISHFVFFSFIVYIGNLKPIFDSISKILDSGDIFAFTVEEYLFPSEKDLSDQSTNSSPDQIDWILQVSGRFAHSRDYILKLIEENEIMNDNSPTSSAAGILYYYSTVKGLGYSKKSFAKACNVSEVTIIKCYKLINIYHTFITTHKSNIFA